MSKICTSCKILKEYSDFRKLKSSSDGLKSTCKICNSIYDKEYRKNNKDKAKKYYEKNREKLLLYKKKYREEHEDKLLKCTREWILKNISRKRETDRKYRLKNKDRVKLNQEKYKNKRNKDRKERWKKDTNFKLVESLRNRLRSAIKGKNIKKHKSTRELVGCNVEELKKYIESKFLPGMTWENYGLYGWHIDHIKPLSKFNLSDPKELSLACHYTNLQPLWAADNLKKRNKYEQQ